MLSMAPNGVKVHRFPLTPYGVNLDFYQIIKSRKNNSTQYSLKSALGEIFGNNNFIAAIINLGMKGLKG